MASSRSTDVGVGPPPLAPPVQDAPAPRRRARRRPRSASTSGRPNTLRTTGPRGRWIGHALSSMARIGGHRPEGSVHSGAPSQLLGDEGAEAVAPAVQRHGPGQGGGEPPVHSGRLDGDRAGAERCAARVGGHGRRARAARSNTVARRASPFSRATATASAAVISTRGDVRSSDGALLHRALAERREHVGDVVEEDPVRARRRARRLAHQAAAVLEQQVGDAVEADRGLAGARAALHDQRPIERRADRRGPARPGSWPRSRASRRCGPLRSRPAPDRVCRRRRPPRRGRPGARRGRRPARRRPG